MCREDSEISELHRPRLDVIDPDGLAVMRGAASPSLRRAILNGLFRDTELTQGQCGGDQMQGEVRGVDGQPWGAGGQTSLRAPLGAAMGVQGQFLLDEKIAAASFAEGPFAQLQRILSREADVLRDFVVDTAEVSYINTTKPERVNTKRTWCGWSFDGDLTKSPVREEVWAKRKDGTWSYCGDAVPKVFLSLGSHAVTWGFKYSKAEGNCLECRVEPGDALIRWGPARSWCSALVGIDAKRSAAADAVDAPFTFAQVKLASHAALQRGNPQLWGKIHDTAKYRGAPFEANRWFQYAFQYVGNNEVEIFRPGSRAFQPGSRVAQPPAGVRFSETTKPGADGGKRWGKKGLAEQSDADAKKIKTEELPTAGAKMRALHTKLERHCSDDSLIKGWEVERRTCNGKARGALRTAAREIRGKAAAAQRMAAQPMLWTPADAQYLAAIEQLHVELAKAREQDFDSLLKDGYDWLTAKLDKASQADSGVSAETWERHTKMCTELLAQLKQHRAHGQHGRAADRDMRKAVKWADKTRVAWAQIGILGEPREDLEVAYLRAVEGLLEELAHEGEADFDGLLRNAVNFLEHGGRRLAV